MVILHLWLEVMHEVPSVHDGPCISLLLLLLLLLLIRLLLLLSFTKESSATASFPLCSLFSCRFKLMQLEEKAGYFMTQEPPGKGPRGWEGRCFAAGEIHRHLASLAATSGAESASSKGVDRPARVSLVPSRGLQRADGAPTLPTLSCSHSETHR